MPIVKAFRLEPSATPEMVLLVSDALAMLDSVLVEPLMVLLVSVCVAVFVVTVSDPTVAEVMLNAPPVTVLPVNVKADGNDKVTLVVPVAVISLAVPLTDATAPMPPAVMVVFPAKVSWPWALTVNVPTCVAEP